MSVSPTIIGSIISAGATLAGVIVSNDMQLRRQTRELKKPAPDQPETKEDQR